MTAVRVRDGGASEGPAVMDGIRVATSPDAKAGRLPHGLSSPESFQNHLNGGKANERCSTGACAFWRDVGRHQLGQGPTIRKKAADTYGEGVTGWPPQQGRYVVHPGGVPPLIFSHPFHG